MVELQCGGTIENEKVQLFHVRGMVELQCGGTIENEIDVDSSHTCTRSLVLVADADGSGDLYVMSR